MPAFGVVAGASTLASGPPFEVRQPVRLGPTSKEHGGQEMLKTPLRQIRCDLSEVLQPRRASVKYRSSHRSAAFSYFGDSSHGVEVDELDGWHRPRV